MAQLRDLAGLCLLAARAGPGLFALLGAGGIGGLGPVAPIVAQSFQIPLLCRIAAGAGSCFVAGLRAGGRRAGPVAPVVAESGGRLNVGLCAGTQTHIGLDAVLRTGGLLNYLLGGGPNVSFLGNGHHAAHKLHRVDDKFIAAKRLGRRHGILRKGERNGMVGGGSVAVFSAAVAEHHGIDAFGVQNDLVVVMAVHFQALRVQHRIAGIGQVLRRGNHAAIRGDAAAVEVGRGGIRAVHKVDVDILRGVLFLLAGALRQLVDGDILLVRAGLVSAETRAGGIVLEIAGNCAGYNVGNLCDAGIVDGHAPVGLRAFFSRSQIHEVTRSTAEVPQVFPIVFKRIGSCRGTCLHLKNQSLRGSHSRTVDGSVNRLEILLCVSGVGAGSLG